MFKIGGDIEITIEDEEVIKKSGYNPIAGAYVCPLCKKKKHSSDFYEKSDPNEILEELVYQWGIDKEKFYAYEGISFIRKFHSSCTNCDFPIDADLIFFVQGMGDNFEITKEICASNHLEFLFPSFLSLGVDIYEILPQLFLRWWRKGYKIDIVVPFINTEYFSLFHNVGKFFITYDKSLSDDDISLDKNPFRYIIFRKVQNRYNGNETTIWDKLKEFYQGIFKKHGDDYFSMNPDGVGVAKDSIYQVVNKVKDVPGDKCLAHKYSGNFHAKFIAGVGEEKAELYLMSYNFGEIEDLQFETHFLVNLDSKKYNNEIQMFINYHRLQFEKITE